MLAVTAIRLCPRLLRAERGGRRWDGPGGLQRLFRASLPFGKGVAHEVVVVRAEVHDFGARVSGRRTAVGRETVARVRL